MEYADARVRVLRSYDYCHFEITLGRMEPGDTILNEQEVDNMRKEAMRLADKAVHQYKIAKLEANNMAYGNGKRDLQKKVRIIEENTPKSEWTEEQKAMVKALDDFEYYDYQDDWDGWDY